MMTRSKSTKGNRDRAILSKSGKEETLAKNSNKGKATAGRGADVKKRGAEREYCSAPCLLGHATGGPLDPRCPNISDHGSKHLKQPIFLRLI